MRKFLSEIKLDAVFIRDHQLQPRWYKFLKIFLLLGVLAGYYLLFGGWKTLVFLACFLGLSLVVHLVYRAQTRKFTQSWLDFKVELVDGLPQPTRIGPQYYLAVIANGLTALLVSQVLVK